MALHMNRKIRKSLISVLRRLLAAFEWADLDSTESLNAMAQLYLAVLSKGISTKAD